MNKWWIFALLVLPTVLLTVDGGSRLMAHAAEDELDEELDVEVEGEDASVTGQAEETETDDEPETTKSPDADTFLLFTRPLYSAGSGSQFELPSESFAGRPFGLNIALNYRDAAGNQFSEAVFNETVSIIEVDEGLDGETFFLYVFLAAVVVLLLVLGQQFLGSYGKRKRSPAVRKTVETGTTNTKDVDYEWIPAETLKKIQNSPKGGKVSPKQSPRQRKAKRAVGAGDD